MEKTDWDDYYKRPTGPVQLTRRISASKIGACLTEALKAPDVRVCELGGANSCFIDSFLVKPNITEYHVVDLNEFGVQLLRKRFSGDARVTVEVSDALSKRATGERYDIVYSVGLIEHFTPDDTARCVASHFSLCRPGGIVLITFPTPTLPYKLIRKFAEAIDLWRFPDERPLSFEEVEGECQRHGVVTHKSINWLIGLTQGYIVCLKDED